MARSLDQVKADLLKFEQDCGADLGVGVPGPKGYSHGWVKDGAPTSTIAKAIDDSGAYRGKHTAPTSGGYGAPMHDLGQLLPADVYDPKTQKQNFGGYSSALADIQTFAAINRAKGRPNQAVKIHRAVPKSVTQIRPGDWVTTSADYAKLHRDAEFGSNGHVISATVPAHELRTAGDLHEWGWNPA